MNSKTDRPAVQALWPLLFVSDIQRSVEFYAGQLGFETMGRADGEAGLFWCRLQRGGACLMLQQRDSTEARGSDGFSLFFVCDDVDQLYQEFLTSGLSLSPPEEAYYGMRQLPVPDPDGFDVIFESPTATWAG